MKHLKKFEEISFSNLFKKKKDKDNKLSVPSEIKTKLELKGYTNIGYDEDHNIIANHPKKGNGILITNDIIESDDLNFFIDKKPYDKNQFGQNKHKVYLFKDDKVYYLGDIRKFKDGESLSYLRLDNIKPVNTDKKYMRDLNKEEMEILDKELDRNVIERDLMADEITYREKIIKEL